MKKNYKNLIVLLFLTLGAIFQNGFSQNTFMQSFNTGNAIYGGNSNAEAGTAVAVDEAGNRYVTGYFEDTIDFDPGIGTTELTSAGQRDIFVAQYAIDGTLVWAKSFGGTSIDLSTGIAVDDNFVYISGYFYEGGAITIGSTTLTSAGGWDMLVLKLNRTNGDAIWAKSYGTAGTDANTQDEAKAIACDNDGNIYLTGVIGSTINGNNGTVISFDGINITIAGRLDIFIAKLNADGQTQWVRGIGGTMNASGESIWVSGNYVYIGGSFYGNVDFNRGSIPAWNLVSASGGFDAFLTKHNLDGELQWAVRMGGRTNDDDVYAIASDSNDNVYATGIFSGTNVAFGNSVSLSSTGTNAFIWKIDSLGQTVWAKNIASSGFNSGNGMAVNNRGEVYAAGTFEENTSFGNGISIASNGFSDVFLAKYDADGNTIWAESFGGTLAESVGNIALYEGREVITAGSFLSLTKFDPDEIAENVSANGLLDFFIHSFTPTPPGSGTENDPFIISNLDELEWIYLHEEHWDKFYRQTAHINASATVYYNGGRGWAPIGNNATQFTGMYDGQGYSITNLTINRIEVGVDENTGLFGYTNFPAVIKNLALLDVNIRGDYVTGSIVGKNYHALVRGCYSSGSVAGRRVVGGLVGENNFVAKIEDSYSTSTVFASDVWAGGISALNFNNASVSKVYNIGVVSSSNGGTGGIVAWNSGSTVENSFWDTETSALDTSDGGEGKTTIEMTELETFMDAGWDVKDGTGSETWNIGNGRNNGYPYLNWQFPNDKGMQFITFNALPVKKYGDAAFELTATASSTLVISYESSNADVVTISGSIVTIVGTGSAQITAKQAGNEKYHPAEDVNQLLTVNKANLTITADSNLKTYGISIDFNGTEFQSVGIVNGDNIASATISSDGAPANANVGEYPVLISEATGSGLSNYSITYEQGMLTVEKRTLAIAGSFTVADKEYDGTTDAVIEANNLILEASLEGDDVFLTGIAVSFELAGPGADIPVLITAADIAGADKNNYELSLEGSPIATANIIDYTEIAIVDKNNTTLYPNPARNLVTIDASSKIQEVYLIDLTGKIILVLKEGASNQMTFNVSALDEGIYLVKIITSESTQVQKLKLEK